MEIAKTSGQVQGSRPAGPPPDMAQIEAKVKAYAKENNISEQEAAKALGLPPKGSQPPAPPQFTKQPEGNLWE